MNQTCKTIRAAITLPLRVLFDEILLSDQEFDLAAGKSKCIEGYFKICKNKKIKIEEHKKFLVTAPAHWETLRAYPALETQFRPYIVCRISLCYKVLCKAGDWLSHLTRDGLRKSRPEKNRKNS